MASKPKTKKANTDVSLALSRPLSPAAYKRTERRDYSRDVQVLLSAGWTVKRISKELDIKEWMVERAKRRAEERYGHMAGDDWAARMALKSKVAIDQGLEDPTFYNPAKVGIAALKGLGIFSPDNQLTPTTIVNQKVLNIIQNIHNYSDEEKREIIDLERKSLPQGAGASYSGSFDAEVEEPDREESALVGEKLYQDV